MSHNGTQSSKKGFISAKQEKVKKAEVDIFKKVFKFALSHCSLTSEGRAALAWPRPLADTLQPRIHRAGDRGQRGRGPGLTPGSGWP